jgi:hypothetical protein
LKTAVPRGTVFGVNTIFNVGEIVVRTTAECFTGNAAATPAAANPTRAATVPIETNFTSPLRVAGVTNVANE